MPFKLKIIRKSGVKMIDAEKGDNLLEILRDNQIEIDSPCGGNGRCGKCRLKFNGKESLACRTFVEGDAEVELIGGDEKYINEHDMSAVSDSDIREGDIFAAAIDIGTTTISAELLCLRNMQSVARESCMNHQKAFGGDVISRIDAAVGGRAASLRAAVQKDIIDLLRKMLFNLSVKEGALKEIVISANTTMIHLLMGLDLSGMASSPFKAERLEFAPLKFAEVFGRVGSFDTKVIIIPGLSAFIGGDIISGIYALKIHEKDEKIGLIDLGTNAEMAVGNRKRIYLASAAAGPAFEGGNISMGMAGVEGAISDVRIDKKSGRVRIKTIADSLPRGICGTGIISAIAEMFRTGIILENGSLKDEYIKGGFTLAETDLRRIKISQEDIHNLMLAKAAAAAGFETIISEAGISFDEISSLYMAGSFAEYLKIEDAAEISLIPRQLKAKTLTVGNSSLKGALRYIRNPGKTDEDIKKILSICVVAELSEIERFEKSFIDNMCFFSYNE
ncbi:MAG: ASKHA domain-containing protein [Lachnospiraceae bacterium]|nr:ASKHA domain-containing protein [Lachnospiraceae bacterium]